MGNVQSLEYISRELEIDEDVLLAIVNEWEQDDYMEGHHIEEEDVTRKDVLARIRLDWISHVEKCLHENSFHKKYRMSHKAFCKLVRILRPKLERDHLKASRGLYINPHIVVAIGVRYLAGEPYTALNDIANISTASVYRLKNRFISALLSEDDLKIKLPEDAEEWERVRQGFENISSFGLFKNTVGAMDGFFTPMIQPRVADCNNNPMAYMSGHYGQFGLNCQAVCDARERFLFFGVVAPGKTNDNIAFEYCTALKEKINELPYGLFMVGDAAYTPCERLLIPLVGAQRLDPVNDAYNFYLSQVRIRIEMAFGRLVNKWRILRSPMLGSLSTISKAIMSCAILHNFVIDEDGHNEQLQYAPEGNNGSDYIVRNAPTGMAYLPTLPVLNEQEIDIDFSSSTIMASLLEVIDQTGVRRPRRNIERNQGVGTRNIRLNNAYYAPE
jgi:hypothetical protein